MMEPRGSSSLGLARVLVCASAFVLAVTLTVAAAPDRFSPFGHPPPAPDPGTEGAPMPTVVARVAKREFRPLEPIIVEVDVRNTSTENLYFSRSPSVHINLEAEVKDAGGDLCPRNHYHEQALWRASVTHNAEAAMLPPGVPFRTQRVIANLVRDMTAPGDYTIVVAVGVRDSDYPATKERGARSQPVPVRVVGPPIGCDERGDPGRAGEAR